MADWLRSAVLSIVHRRLTLPVSAVLLLALGGVAAYDILDPAEFKEAFEDDFDWAAATVPFFECSDDDITAAYAFRWRAFKAHIKREAPGYVVTEFLPLVSWAGKYNTISGSTGHHIYEGRWLKDSAIIDDYSKFWFSDEATPRSYTAWLTNAIYNRALVDGRIDIPIALVDDMVTNLEAWQQEHFVKADGCFFQSDTLDGGEDSISSGGCRVSINSVMVRMFSNMQDPDGLNYGEMMALAAILKLAARQTEADAMHARAQEFREHILNLLWEPDLQFLVGHKPAAQSNGRNLLSRAAGAPEWPPGERIPVRELLALTTPYYFGLIPVEEDALTMNYTRMWDQLLDPEGFGAEWGPRTAERRHPEYNFTADHPCTWNGPSWPFETSRLLTGLGNFLNNYPAAAKSSVSKSTWLSLLAQYARIHTRAQVREPSDVEGNPVPEHPWIGESLHPDDGYWIAREYMWSHHEDDWRREYLYNHATFADQVITGLAGLRPRDDDVLEINPLIDSGFPYFALEGVSYHGHTVSISWDADGSKYGRKGLSVWVDGSLAIERPNLESVKIPLAPTATGDAAARVPATAASFEASRPEAPSPAHEENGMEGWPPRPEYEVFYIPPATGPGFSITTP